MAATVTVTCAKCGRTKEVPKEEFDAMMALYERRFGALPPELFGNPVSTCDPCTKELLGDNYQAVLDMNKSKLN
jgi:hypothetical protein